MRRRRIRLTPFGYLFVAVLVLLVLGGLYLVIRGIGGDDGERPSVSADTPSPTIVTPTPTQSPDSGTGSDPQGSGPLLPAESASGTLPIVTPEISFITPEPTQTPTPTPTPDKEKPVRTPSPSEEAKAQSGKLKTGGVVLRAEPNTEGAILGKYRSGTNLAVYGKSGDYYYVQIVKEKKYGYMAVKFIEVDMATPEPIETSLPEGTVGGKVSSSLVALRSAPDLNDNGNKVGEAKQGEPVYIYYKYTNPAGDTFYYLQVARTGKKAFAIAKYISAESSVPSGTP